MTSFRSSPKISMGPLTDTQNCGLRTRWESRERFPRRRFQRKLLVSDPGMHHGTCLTLVSWCMSGSLTRGGGKNVPGIPGACATRNFTYLARGPCLSGQIRISWPVWVQCWTFVNLNVYIYVPVPSTIMNCLLPVNEELIKSRTVLKYMLKSFFVLYLFSYGISQSSAPIHQWVFISVDSYFVNCIPFINTYPLWSIFWHLFTC